MSVEKLRVSASHLMEDNSTVRGIMKRSVNDLNLNKEINKNYGCIVVHRMAS